MGRVCVSLERMSRLTLSRILTAMPLGMGGGLFAARDLRALPPPQRAGSDLHSLRSDWLKIGGDFRVAAQKLQAETERRG